MAVIDQLISSLKQQAKDAVPVQTVWAECVSASLEDGTMTASREGIEYFDVLLGLGGDMAEPHPGSMCLLGLVENKREAAFLIYAQNVNRRTINGDVHGGLVKADAVAAKLQALEQDVNQLKALVTMWVPVPADGGAALKAALVAWVADPLMPTVSQQLQNLTVSHG